MWVEASRRGRMRTVVVMTRDESSGGHLCRIPDKLAERFAGYEPDDEAVWGSDAIRHQGLWWLPQLVGRRLAVPNESLGAFRQECDAVLAQVDALAEEADCGSSDIRQTLQNF